MGVAHTRLGAGTDAGDAGPAPVPVGTGGHPRLEPRHPLRPALVESHRQGVLCALVVQELPAQRQRGQSRGQPSRVLECDHTLGEVTERDLAAGLTRAAVHGPRELPVRLGGIGLSGEQWDRRGVLAE